MALLVHCVNLWDLPCRLGLMQRWFACRDSRLMLYLCTYVQFLGVVFSFSIWSSALFMIVYCDPQVLYTNFLPAIVIMKILMMIYNELLLSFCLPGKLKLSSLPYTLLALFVFSSHFKLLSYVFINCLILILSALSSFFHFSEHNGESSDEWRAKVGHLGEDSKFRSKKIEKKYSFHEYIWFNHFRFTTFFIHTHQLH